MHIEDQVQTKRCGHLMGKQVVSREEFLTRIRAAVIARDSIPGNSDFVCPCILTLSTSTDNLCSQVIIGRTDSAQVLGMEEAVIRLKLAADAGADVCFIEGVKTEELLRSTVAALAPKPVSGIPFRYVLSLVANYPRQVLVNVISGGLTPSFTSQEAEKMGAKIISKFYHLWVPVTYLNRLIHSFLIGVCRRHGPRCPRCHALPEEDRYRLQLCKGHGPQIFLRGDGPQRGY